MSHQEQALVSLLSQLALSFDGAVLGFALAYAAIRTLFKFSATSAALRKLRRAPYLSVSDLRSLLADTPSDADSTSDGGTIVIVRGTVDAKSAVDGSWKTLRPGVLVSRESGDKGVILQRTQTCIYNEWKGLFGWTSDLRAIFARSWRQQESTSLRKVPFVLIDVGRRPSTLEYVVVNMDGSRHPLPLTTVYHKLQPINASPYTFLQALFGHEYPVGLLDEEKILPLGKDITAVGLGSLNNGVVEIKSCKDLPYFLSDLSKDQMIVDLSIKTKILFWGGVALGSMSVGILGYAVVRNWNKWKQWKLQRQLQQQRQAVSDVEPQVDDEIEDVPDGQLCVICLMRRRRSVFIPCGHLVCCQGCAISVEREVAPKCPVCRQEIRNSVRIFES
ncbi:baculoviral IAP repeat-containing 2/3/4 [Vigna unguiculata]|uniref:RING-type E3 ubiquitin transferase n=1 Tax=Vigna unguiculata TaxID=3917 RepID=A0A4D6MNQ2_VIGUN|nr:baculoviral IAP repeat-containing 2/3/4 [Vigna unguiculata]